MSNIAVAIDPIHGKVKITVTTKDDKDIVDFKWCMLEDNSTGFTVGTSSNPILLTEVAAEQFLRLVIASLIKKYGIKPGELKIYNHMGDSLSDVQFLPPTFDGDESDLTMFVARQSSLVKLYSEYETTKTLDATLMDMLRHEYIEEDFLNLVNLQNSGIFMVLSQPNQ